MHTQAFKKMKKIFLALKLQWRLSSTLSAIARALKDYFTVVLQVRRRTTIFN